MEAEQVQVRVGAKEFGTATSLQLLSRSATDLKSRWDKDQGRYEFSRKCKRCKKDHFGPWQECAKCIIEFYPET